MRSGGADGIAASFSARSSSPFLWGMFFANLVGGLPIDAAGDYAGGVLDLFSPYTMLGGLVVLSMFVTHGAIFLALKTSGGIRHDARELATRLGVVTIDSRPRRS